MLQGTISLTQFFSRLSVRHDAIVMKLSSLLQNELIHSWGNESGAIAMKVVVLTSSLPPVLDSDLHKSLLVLLLVFLVALINESNWDIKRIIFLSIRRQQISAFPWSSCCSRLDQTISVTFRKIIMLSSSLYLIWITAPWELFSQV